MPVRDGEAGRSGLPAFLRRNWPALLFGGLHTFCSSPGQTIVVGVFIPSFAAAFGLSAGEIGGIYMLANLASAATLLALGHLIDVTPLRLFSSATIAGLAASCAILAIAPHPLVLGLGFYAVRLTGQGLMVHIEATATARAFTADRGRALGITALGLPIADGLMPGLMVASIALLGWRPAYAAIAAVLLVLVLPAARALAARIPAGPAAPPHGISHFARLGAALAILARSRIVWAALPAFAILPFMLTGVFFYAAAIAEARGWPRGLIAASFPVMAASHVAALFVSGYLIDRFSGRMLFAAYAWPALLGMVILAAVDAPWAVPLAMLLIGLSGGIGKTTGTAIWAELFGTANLGAMRSFVAMYTSLATALAPFIWGLLVDAGRAWTEILIAFAALGALAALPIAILELRARRPR